MKKPKLIHLMGALVILVAISVGFYYNIGDNHSKSTPDATSHGEQYNGTSDNITAGTWTAGATIGSASLAGGAATYMRNDTGWLYYIGGDLDFGGTMTTRNTSYNTITNSWTINAVCPSTIEYTGCARLKDTIYICGGMTTSYFSSEVATMQKYNIRANTWSTGAPLPQALGGNKAVGYQDSLIYDAGGMNAGGSNAINNVYLYNCNTNTWRTATPLPAVLCSGAFTVVGDSLFYVGGGATYFGAYSNVVYKGLISQSNRSSITWTTVAAYTGPSRWRFDAAPWGTKGIIVGAGGLNTTFGSSNECYVLNANVWTAQPTMTTAVGSAGVGSVIYSNGIGKFIVASGEDYPNSPYTTTANQIYTDTVGSPGPPPPPALPPYYNYQISEGANSYPFNVSTGKEVQWLVNPHEFNQPSGSAPSGVINAVYFYMAGTGANTFSHLLIKFGLTTLTSLPAGVIYTGQLDTVYYKDTVTLSSTTNSWMLIPLTRPYTYDTSKSLVIDVSQCGYTGTGGMTVNQHTLTPVRRCYINGTIGCVFTYGGQDGTIANCGINVLALTGINHNINIIPSAYSLDQNYPNPFNPTTIINYSLPKAGNVELKVYDLLGREVASLVNGFKQVGSYSVQFNANNFASGVYFYKLKAGDFVSTKKMLLVK